jgi:TRAP-type mannitol/chloroaromatic compound transport system permease large subunit
MSPEFIAISMFVVLVIFLFMGHPLAFVLGGVGVLFGLMTQGWNFFGMVMTRIYGTMDNFVLVAITLFILMGNFLTLSGVADALFKALRVLFGPSGAEWGWRSSRSALSLRPAPESSALRW